MGAEFCADILTWIPSEEIIQDGAVLNVYPPAGEWRYFRMKQSPDRIPEVKAFKDGKPLAHDGWRGSNLFAHPDNVPAVSAWTARIWKSSC